MPGLQTLLAKSFDWYKCMVEANGSSLFTKEFSRKKDVCKMIMALHTSCYYFYTLPLYFLGDLGFYTAHRIYKCIIILPFDQILDLFPA